MKSIYVFIYNCSTVVDYKCVCVCVVSVCNHLDIFTYESVSRTYKIKNQQKLSS